jgi:F-type H+-transporting ATPase subunit b
MEFLKLLSTNEIVAQILSFLVLLLLLRIFAWRKFLQILDERKQRISSEFKKIDDTKLEISNLKTDYEARLAAIEETTKIKIQEAVDSGKQITEETRKNANLEAQKIIDNARLSIKYELSQAKEELKEKIIELTIKATENVIQEKLTAENDAKLVKDFLDQVDELE